MSYSFDVYHRKTIAEESFLKFLNYVTFFPQLVAGPIVRYNELRDQFANPVNLNQIQYEKGCRLILYGLFLKVCLADNLAPFVDDGFLIEPIFFGAVDVLTLAYAFGFQIYFDFAGYSLIAIGAAKLFGISLPQNFKFPYLAISMRDFWQRWHISLSNWIRDYLYETLRAKFSPSGTSSSLALFIAWGLMGFWHGASWNFVMWGIWNAVFILIYRIVYKYSYQLGLTKRIVFITVIQWGLTLNIIMLGWIFFRAGTIDHALSLYLALFGNELIRFTLSPNIYFICLCLMVFVLMSPYIYVLLMKLKVFSQNFFRYLSTHSQL